MDSAITLLRASRPFELDPQPGLPFSDIGVVQEVARCGERWCSRAAWRGQEFIASTAGEPDLNAGRAVMFTGFYGGMTSAASGARLPIIVAAFHTPGRGLDEVRKMKR